MSNSLEECLIGVFDLNEAKTHQLKLKEKKIDLIFKTHPSTCTSGCKVTVEVWCKPTDLNFIQEYFKEAYLKNLSGHSLDFKQLNEVFDSHQEKVICQACGESFSSQLTTCPSCGLVYF